VQSARHFLSARRRELTAPYFLVYPWHKSTTSAFLKKSVEAANMTAFYHTNPAWVSPTSVSQAVHLSNVSKVKSSWATSEPNKWPVF
jgi:hypothetical protein